MNKKKKKNTEKRLFCIYNNPYAKYKYNFQIVQDALVSIVVTTTAW